MHIYIYIYIYTIHYPIYCASLVAQMVKESACNAADLGSIPGSGRSPGERMVTHSSILAWRILWMEEPGRLRTMG